MQSSAFFAPDDTPDDTPEDPTDDFWADPRVGALIEQAEECQLIDDHAGAIALLDRAIAAQNPDSGYAMAARAMSLFKLGRQGEARSQLEALRKYRPFSAIAFHCAAEAAELSGDHRLALRWFEMGLSRCTDQLQYGVRDDAELAPQVAMLVTGRWRVRRALGLPVDEMDQAAAPEPQVAYPGELPPGVATSTTVVRVPYWPRDQLVPASTRWPTVVQDTDAGRVIRDRELQNRQLAAEDGARIVMVPLTVETLIEFADRTGGDPLNAMTRTEALQERYEQGAGIPWPPPRNSRCWCGSQLKYKKCCGAIIPASN